jgi:hypothetical protein
MIRKLLSLLKSIVNPTAPVEEEELPPVLPIKEPSVEVNIDTGKIVFPDHLTNDEKQQLEDALAEFSKSLNSLPSTAVYKSLEDFLSEGGDSGGMVKLWEGLNPVNSEEGALFRISEEMEFCEEQTEHWNDEEFAEALLDLESQGFDFSGVDKVYSKIANRQELNATEKKILRDCFVLATQGFIYEV